MWRDAFRGGPRASLRVKLVAVSLCLLAAGATVILMVGASVLRGQLTRQAGSQLRVYAGQLASSSFQLLGTARNAPAVVPFDGTGTGGEARAPGTAQRAGAAGAASASAAPSAPGGRNAVAGRVAMVGVFHQPGDYSIELRGPDGQLLLSAGPGTRLGLALPKPFAPVPARTGLLRTVSGVGGSYLVIAEPVHFTAQRLLFGYGANDFAINGGPRSGQTGQTGTLVVGLRLASIDQPVGLLSRLAAAVSAVAILLAGGLAWAAIRFSLRPVTRAAQAADAATTGMARHGSGPVHPEPQRPAGRLTDSVPDGLAGSLNTALSQLDRQFTASENAEAVARAATGLLAARLESVAEALRRPISLLHGRAEHWAHRDRGPRGDPDRALTQITGQVADAEALLDEVDDARG